MKIGYGRISTKDQKLEMQTEALLKAGCELIYKETQSAVKERPELQNMLNHLRQGDVVVVWKLDRLGRSLKHLIDLVTGFREKGIEFISLNDSIDTTTVPGQLTFNIFASFAEFERELIRERTMAGLQAARKRGRIGGRKKGLSPVAKRTAYACYQLWEDKSRTIPEVLKIVKVSRATFYRYIAWVKEQNGKKKEE